MTGIYCITNLINNKKYVGSSSRLEKRWIEHKHELNHQKHNNPYLQNSWNEYGAENFKFEIVESCKSSELLDCEHWWIEHFQSFRRDCGYNLHRFPKQTRLGLKASPETLRKMSIANGGKNHPNWGKKLSASHVANMRKAVKGIKKPTSGKRKKIKIINDKNEIFEVDGVRRFCREYKLTLSGFWLMTIGKTPSYKGWRLLS